MTATAGPASGSSRPVAAGVASPTARRLLWAAIAAGVVLRWWWVLGADFPVNDGGLFHQMVRDLQADGYGLPLRTTYNLGDIAFAYPPLGLYLAAVLDDFSPLSLTTVLRLVPALFATAQLLVMVRIARIVVVDERAVAAAVGAFAVLGPAIGFQVMGGGVTRAPGVAAALVAVWQLLESSRSGGRRHLVGAGVAAGVAVLTHPEAALFVVVSAPVLTLVGPARLTVRRLGLVTAVAAAVCAPWALTVLGRHGVDTFLGAASGGNRLLVLTLVVPSTVTAEVVPVVGGAALVGLVLTWRRGDPRLVVWTLALFLANPRSADQRVAVPLALAAGVAVSWLVARLAARGVRRELVGAGAAVAVLVVLFNAVRIGPVLQPVSADQRQAMAWVAAEVAPDAVFVVAEDGPWYRARAGEWFPVLAQRPALTTAQGREFADTGGSFTELLRRRDRAMDCVFAGPDCLTRHWSEPEFTHVYVAKPGPAGSRERAERLAAALAADERFTLLYDSRDAAVYELR